MSVNYRELIHPEDDAARQQLEAIPGFHAVAKSYLALYDERKLHGSLMAQKVRLSPTQLPEIYNLLPPVCRKFGIDEPEFYLEMDPNPNACSWGDKQTFVCVSSGLITGCKNEEVQAVIAHECGHILCRHCLYRTIVDLLRQMGESSLEHLLKFVGIMLVPISMPIQLALMYWYRRSELSADRASVVYMGKTEPVINALVRLAGGPCEITGNINIQEYSEQARSYQDLYRNSKWDKVLQNMAIMDLDHPFPSVRVHELLKWAESDQYQRLHESLEKQTESVPCVHCGKNINKNHKFCRYCGTSQQ